MSNHGIDKDSLEDMLAFIKKCRKNLEDITELHVLQSLCKDIKRAFAHQNRLHDVVGFRNQSMTLKNLLTLSEEVAHNPTKAIRNRGQIGDIISNLDHLLSSLKTTIEAIIKKL